jgi:putative phosphoesterase
MTKKIGILSDTHGYIPEKLFDFFRDCDEIWHAGDWGNIALADRLMQFKPLRGVYGNIDGGELRVIFNEFSLFKCEGMKICLMHIGGYPGRYSPLFKKILATHKPDMMVCGHSHILKVIYDQKNKLLHINPGACGISGFHQMSTAIRLEINNGKPQNLEVWEQPKFAQDATV